MKSDWRGRSVLVLVALAFVLLNLRSRRTHYPETLSGIWDAPYTNLVLLHQMENDEFHAVQYGFPFDAYERWSHRDFPSVVESAILLGAFGNVLLLSVFLVVLRKVSRACALRPPKGRSGRAVGTTSSIHSVVNRTWRTGAEFLQLDVGVHLHREIVILAHSLLDYAARIVLKCC